MSKVAFPVTTFQAPDGTPVSNGSLLIRLSTNGSINNTQIQNNFTRFKLDSSGVTIGSPVFWPNASITPSNTYYVFSVYTNKGQLVSGPNRVSL